LSPALSGQAMMTSGSGKINRRNQRRPQEEAPVSLHLGAHYPKLYPFDG